MSSFPTNQLFRSNSSPRPLVQQLVPTNATSLYETPSLHTATVRTMWLCNGSTNSATVSVHHVPPKASPTQGNALLYSVAIAARSTVIVDQPISMALGDRLYARASAASAITLTAYGEEQVG